MSTGSGSESGNDPKGQQSTAQAAAVGTVEGGGGGRGVAASGGLRLPLRVIWLR
jgi:hypothetical protein